jgi:PAS domain S-box-containing protein
MQPDSELMERIENVLRFRTKGMSISEIARTTKLNRNSVAKYLEMMRLSGQVERHYVGSAKVYTLSHRLPLPNILSFSSDYIVVLDDSGRIVQVNDQYLELCGKEKEEVISERIDETSLPLLNTPEIREVVAGGGTEDGCSRDLVFLQDGNALHFRARSVPTVLERDENGLIVLIEDITEEVTTREQLQLQEQSLRGVLEGQTELICCFTPDQRHTFTNDAYCEYFGLKKDDLIGHRFRPRIHPEDRERLHNHFASLSPDQPRKTISHRIIRRGGEISWVQWSDRAIFDGNDQVVGYQSVGRDITGERAAEERLRDAVRRLGDIIDFLPDATFVIDEKGSVIAWNRAIEEMTGRRREEMVGKQNDEYSLLFYGKRREMLIDLTSADDVRLASLYPNFWREKMRIIAETYCPMVYGGTGAHLRMSASPLCDHTGRIVGAIESLRNITQIVETEEELERSRDTFATVAELSPNPVAICDKDGSFLYLNKKFSQVFGFTIRELRRVEDWILQNFPDASSRARAQERWEAICTPGGPADIPLGSGLRCADGTMRDILVHRSVSGGRMRIIIFEDITGKKEAEEDRARYVRHLEFLSTTATEFAEMPAGSDLYSYIARRLRELAPGSLVVVGSIDQESGDLTVSAVAGRDDRIEAVQTTLGQPILGLGFRFPPSALERLRTGKLQVVEDGILQLTGGQLSKPVCRTLEEILDPGPVYSAGFAWQQNLSGAAAIILTAGGQLPDPYPVEVFIQQASVALQKHMTEEELKNAYHERTRRLIEHEHDLVRTHEILELEIAEHRYTRRELMKQRELTHLCYNLMDIFVIGIDRHGRIFRINPNGSALLGMPENEIVGRSWVDSFIPSRFRADFSILMEKIGQGRVDATISLKPVVTADGGELELIWLIKRLKDEKASPESFLLLGERPPGAKVMVLYHNLHTL